MNRLIMWVTASTPRWVTLLMMLYMGLLSGVGLSAVMARQEQDKYEACVSRSASRADVRGALIGIYDTLDPNHQSDKVALLRTSLDENYPPVNIEDC